MRTCTQCGVEFAPTTQKGYRCPPCRLTYDRAWRKRRKAEGLPSSGSRTWNPEKRAAWTAVYYQREDVRARKAAKMRGYSKSPDLRDRHRARRSVRREIAAGRLVRQPCEVCGSFPTDAHHDDYSKPLEVRWLCRPHHIAHHARAEGKGA